MNMDILFEHNRKAYKSAVSMMEKTGRAAIIHPTGTGKSFIAFQLCADNPDKTVCWLSPSAYIFGTQKEKWFLAGGEELKNIRFFTYAGLMRMGEEELLGIEPSYIVLDEFHRCGAACWGDGVARLRKHYPKAFLLGLSATGVRYLDNRRDMALELFGGNIAGEISLGGAIAKGILPTPKYVLSVYSWQKELERYSARVRRTRNRAVHEAAEKEFEALRRALLKADGLEEVFARHMGESEFEKYGKYIVFCASYEHLKEMRGLATKWFARVDGEPHVYTAYSNNPETEAQFEAFKADGSNHLKLLYCIDMLNEGIHVDGLNGVILLRPTVSPVIYKQQIGRALAAGGKKVPVVFDIVMNIENLLSVGAIEEELSCTVLDSRGKGRGNEIINEHFTVVDEVKDCRRLFARLNEILNASWDTMYRMAEEYYKDNGNLLVPVAYVTESGYPLGAWIATQRKVFAGKTAGYLDACQVEQLEAIGMCWQGAQEAGWEKNFAQAEKYFKEHGNLLVPADYVTKDGCGLGRWVRRQREKYRGFVRTKEFFKEGSDGKKNHFHSVRIERLSGIGMVWEENDPWEYKFELAKQYYEEHGNLRMPNDYVAGGVWLERWLREQRARFSEDAHKPLTEGQKEKLLSLGIKPGVSQAELAWRKQYGEAEEFYQKYGNLSVPKQYMAGSGKNLGNWLKHQRERLRKGKLSGWQETMLNGIGMIWELPDAWDTGFLHAEEYFRQNGDLNVPNAYICPDGYRLGKWISNQRYAYGGNIQKGLVQPRIQRLNELNMVWNAGQGRRVKKGSR